MALPKKCWTGGGRFSTAHKWLTLLSLIWKNITKTILPEQFKLSHNHEKVNNLMKRLPVIILAIKRFQTWKGYGLEDLKFLNQYWPSVKLLLALDIQHLLSICTWIHTKYTVTSRMHKHACVHIFASVYLFLYKIMSYLVSMFCFVPSLWQQLYKDKILVFH